MTEEDLRVLLREMRDEPIPADSLARVRIGVAENGARKHQTFWKGFAACTAGVAVLVLALLFNRPSEVAPPAPLVAKIPAPMLAFSTPATERVAPVRRPPKHRIRKPVPLPETEDIVVRIETADPDVVILLVGE